MVATPLFIARAAAGIWRSRPSYSTEAAKRLMRRVFMAGHLFIARAAAGIWRSRPSYSTEAAKRLIRRVTMAKHLFTPRAATGIGRSRLSYSTEAATRLLRTMTMVTRHFFITRAAKGTWFMSYGASTRKRTRWRTPAWTGRQRTRRTSTFDRCRRTRHPANGWGTAVNSPWKVYHLRRSVRAA